MANINLNIIINSRTMSQLRKGVRKDGSTIWAGRAMSHASAISRSIGNMLVNKFNNTAVAKSLRGQGSTDLPSHFGLTDATANELADGMAELIRTSIKLSARSSARSVSIQIRAVSNNWGTYLTLPGAQYVSHPSEITIPVVKWLLMDPNIDIGQAAYDIVFEGKDNNINARIRKVSRSGRAIMVSLDSLGGSGGYVLPGIVSGESGQNFIEYTLGQRGVAIEAATILMKKVR